MRSIQFKARPVWKKSDATYTGRAVCVALEPSAILVRLFGTRTTLRLPIQVAFFQAAALEARRIKSEKEQAKRERKATRKASR